MGEIPSSEEEFKAQMREIENKINSSKDFFSTLNENKLTPQGIAEIIDVKNMMN